MGGKKEKVEAIEVKCPGVTMSIIYIQRGSFLNALTVAPNGNHELLDEGKSY